jgi:hypothetical protein
MATQLLDIRTFPTASPPPLEPLKSAPGLQSIYQGAQLECPSTTTLVLHWSSAEAYRSGTSTTDLSHYASAAQVPVVKGVPTAALNAPCTEVMTAYGVEEGTFLKQCGLFMDRVDAGVGRDEGYHGYALGGETLGDVKKVDGGPSGKGVVLILGWDSKEAHLQAKGKPGRKLFIFFSPADAEPFCNRPANSAAAISDNINLVRSAREDVSLVSVRRDPLVVLMLTC